MPSTLRRRRVPTQDIEIAVIRTNFVKGIVWAVPLIQYFFDQILATLQSKPHWPFVRRPPGVAIHL
jgi:hypothetical protein